MLRLIIYGYPAPRDLERVEFGLAELGGPLVGNGQPNWRCAGCDHAWLHLPKESGADAVSVEEIFCHYCSELLSPSDRLRHEVAVEEYLAEVSESESNAAAFALDSDTFGAHPIPVCKHCRASIHENLDDIAAESHDTKAQQLLRKCCWALIAMMALLQAIQLMVH